MADLMLKVGDRSQSPADYQDGDILCAFNRRRIRCVHAEDVCHLDRAGFTRDGLRPMAALARDFREAVCQFRFERVSATEIERVEIATGTRVRFGAVPVVVDGVRQHIDVEAFVRRRQRHPRHGLFNVPGAEQWYGGREDRSHARLDLVWQAVEAKTPRREVEAAFQHWPAGVLDLRHHLVIAVDEFDDAQADVLVSAETDERQVRDEQNRPVVDPDTREPVLETVTLQRRVHRVNIDAALGLSSVLRQRVRDPQQMVDLRTDGTTYTRTAIVTEKTRVRTDVVSDGGRVR